MIGKVIFVISGLSGGGYSNYKLALI